MLRSRKDKLAYSILSDSKTAIDSCVTKNNFSVALSIHFLASSRAPVRGSGGSHSLALPSQQLSICDG